MGAGRSGRTTTLLTSLPGGVAPKGALLGVVAGVAASSKLPLAGLLTLHSKECSEYSKCV